MVDVVSCDADTLRHVRQKQVAMVFQQFALAAMADGGARMWASASSLPAFRRPSASERVDKQLKLVGLDNGRTSMCMNFRAACSSASGLARAFATDAPILLDG